MSRQSGFSQTISIILGISIVLCLCVVSVLGVVYWRYRDQAARLTGLLGLTQQTQAAKMMPADAGVYVGLSLNLQAQAGYQNLKSIYLDNPDTRKVLDDLKASLKAETGIDFDQDVVPWLGSEAAWSIHDLAQMSGPGQPDFVVVVSTRDVKASEAVLDKLRAYRTRTSSQAFEQRQHGTVAYWFQPAKSEQEGGMVQAIVNNFVVLANTEKGLLGALDRATTGGESLAANRNFQAVMQALPRNAAVLAYVDATRLISATEQPNRLLLLPMGQLPQLAGAQGIGVGITLQTDGMQLDMVAQYDQQKLPKEAQSALSQPGSPNSVLTRIPADALFFLNGNNLRGIWQTARESMATSPDFEKQLADIQKQNNINVDEDVFGWMTGEYALVTTKAQPTGLVSPPLGGYLLIGAGDPKAAQDKVSRLFDQMGQGMTAAFTTTTVEGHSLQAMTDPISNTVMAAYGFWDNYFMAGYSPDALKAAFGSSGNAMAASPRFRAVANRLPTDNYGYFYANMGDLRGIIETLTSASDSPDYAKVKPFLEPLRALGVAVSPSRGAGTTPARMFLLITKQ
jgi:hypothetical protein